MTGTAENIEAQSVDDIVRVRSGADRRCDRGASLVEYALLVALIAVVCILSIAYFGTQTDDTFSRVSSSVQAT